MMGIDDEELNAFKISTQNDKNMYNKLVYVTLNMCRAYVFKFQNLIFHNRCQYGCRYFIYTSGTQPGEFG